MRPRQKVADTFPCLERGEILCAAYEAFQTLVPDTVMTIDHAALLAIALTQADEITWAHCTVCKGLLVTDLLALESRTCVYCEDRSGSPSSEPPTGTSEAASGPKAGAKRTGRSAIKREAGSRQGSSRGGCSSVDRSCSNL